MADIKSVGICRKGTISLLDLINLARENPNLKQGGAIATFTGIVRGYTNDGKKVNKLEIEACEDEAKKALAEISKELCGRPGVIDVLMYHLVGEFCVSDDLVYIVVIGKSRRDAFQALEEAVERYKKNAEIWKKEYLEDGSCYWISE
jgi:molybdopterin synthase catalytic subunit